MAQIASGHVARNALVLIAVVVIGAAVWWMRSILTPLVLALFLMVLIDGLARILEHRIPRFPHKAAMPVALIVAVALFGLTIFLIAVNTRSFAGQLIGYGPKLQGRILQLAAQFGLSVPPTLGALVAQLNPERFITPVAAGLQDILSGAVFVLIYLGFLLASRHGFNRKIVTLFPSRDRRETAVRIFARIRNAVERYVWVQTLTGAVIAALAWALMAVVGLDNAPFWAFFIFVAAYIPMLGAAVAILAPAIFALVQFETYWQALVLLGGIEVIFFVIGNMLLPKLQGESLNLDPVVVLLSLAFWGALWGLPGAFLSSPLTVVAMVILVQFPGTRWIAVLLSDDGYPEQDGGGVSDPAEPPRRARRPRRAPAPKA